MVLEKLAFWRGLAARHPKAESSGGVTDARPHEGHKKRGRPRGPHTTKACAHCGKQFGLDFYPSRLKRTEFCSRKCAAIAKPPGSKKKAAG